MEELNRKVPQLPWIVAAIGIIIAGYFFLSASKISTEILNHQNELDAYNLKLAQYKKLEETYGHGSDKYYADKPLLILKPEGDKGKFKIYLDFEGKEKVARWACSENSKGITIKWGEPFKNNMTDLFVTPGKQVGSYLITLTENTSDDKFQVLVVVK